MEEEPKEEFPVTISQSANAILVARSIAKNVVAAVVLNVGLLAIPTWEKFTHKAFRDQ